MKNEYKDMVRNPTHYQGITLETIDVIEDFKLNFNLGNSIKYILRCGKKDINKSVEDLKKAIWYLDREIHNLETLNIDRNKKNTSSTVTNKPAVLHYDDGVIYDENGSQVNWVDVVDMESRHE